ncbi:MAG: hypothetical protein WD872_19180 [Pirellulaceae bacterium]
MTMLLDGHAEYIGQHDCHEQTDLWMAHSRLSKRTLETSEDGPAISFSDEPSLAAAADRHVVGGSGAGGIVCGNQRRCLNDECRLL